MFKPTTTDTFIFPANHLKVITLLLYIIEPLFSSENFKMEVFFMKQRKKRKNNTGSAVFLGNNRYKPWAARIVIGKNIEGVPIYFDIDNFETELDALVCLENYHKEPYPLYVQEKKYNKISTFPQKPYPLVSVKNPNIEIIEKTRKDNYTFKQLFEEFKEMKLPTDFEIKLEKEKHIKPKGKFGRHYARGMITAFHNCEPLYDKVYRDLKTSDFQTFLNNCGKGYDPLKQMVNLFKNMDNYALQEDIIEKGYSQHIKINNTKTSKKPKTIYSYEQIKYLWNIKPEDYKEEFVRDILLLALYTGCRADELLFIYTKNIFLDNNYFIGGLKTQAGINREIPIHPRIKPIFEKYYNNKNEFLFHMPSTIANNRKANYDYYLYHYKLNFIEKHPKLEHHTAHECRHTLRTELERLNIKQVIINSILGHSNDDTGLDVYTHISIEEKLEAIKMVTYKDTKKLYVLSANQQQKLG